MTMPAKNASPFARQPDDQVTVWGRREHHHVEVSVFNPTTNTVNVHAVEVDENGFLKIGGLKRTTFLTD